MQLLKTIRLDCLESTAIRIVNAQAEWIMFVWRTFAIVLWTIILCRHIFHVVSLININLKPLNLLYKNLQEKLKSAYESCTNDTECCCGQYCSFNSNNNTSVCQCSSDRWWNDAINYCRILLNIIFLIYFNAIRPKF